MMSPWGGLPAAARRARVSGLGAWSSGRFPRRRAGRVCDSGPAETATQALHRLTWIERWDEALQLKPPVDDPRVVRGFTPVDLGRLPWFYKRYHDGLPRIDLPRRLPATLPGAVDV